MNSTQIILLATGVILLVITYIDFIFQYHYFKKNGEDAGDALVALLGLFLIIVVIVSVWRTGQLPFKKG